MPKFMEKYLPVTIDLGGFIKKQNAEISYHFAKAFWGGGLASEAVQIVTKFGMEELGLSRIQGMVMVDNQASVRVLVLLTAPFVRNQSVSVVRKLSVCMPTPFPKSA